MTELLQSLMSDCEIRLAILNQEFDCEINKPLSEQRTNFLRFLDKERAVYMFGIFLLKQLEVSLITHNKES